MTAFSAILTTTAVLLSAAHCATARELSGGDLPPQLVTSTGLRCGQTEFEACCPAEFGACAPGLVCMGAVCEPCGDEGEEKCDDNASRVWSSTFMVEEDEAAVVTTATIDMNAVAGMYGTGSDGEYGGYGDDDDGTIGTYGSDRAADGGSENASGDSDGDEPATESQDGSSANVNSGAGSNPTVVPTPAPGTTPRDGPSEGSSSSIAPATAAVVGVAALVAGVGAIAYVKRATLFNRGAAAAA